MTFIEWDTLEDAAVAASQRSSMCGVGKLIETLRNAEQSGELPHGAGDAALQALENTAVTAGGFLAALRSRLDVSWNLPGVQTVERHRRKACGCPDLWVHE